MSQDDDNPNFLMHVCRHELGHAIGLLHEHQREDRGQFVRYIGTTPNDPNIVSLPVNRRAWLYSLIVEWKWEKIATWTIWYIEWVWVGGEWWQGGHWEARWKSYNQDIYGWVPYHNWAPYETVNTHTPTPYDVRSVMHYFGVFRLRRDYQNLPADHTIDLNDVNNITNFDAQCVRELYTGWYWW